MRFFFTWNWSVYAVGSLWKPNVASVMPAVTMERPLPILTESVLSRSMLSPTFLAYLGTPH